MALYFQIHFYPSIHECEMACTFKMYNCKIIIIDGMRFVVLYYDLAVLFHRRRFLRKPCGHHNNIIIAKLSHPDNITFVILCSGVTITSSKMYSSRLSYLRILAND